MNRATYHTEICPYGKIAVQRPYSSVILQLGFPQELTELT